MMVPLKYLAGLGLLGPLLGMPGDRHVEPDGRNKTRSAIQANIPMEVAVDSGWQPFIFTNRGFRQVFHYISPSTSRFSVTDAFCAGDSFAVYDNKELLGVTPAVVASCDKHTSDPQVAFNSTEWSHGGFVTEPGERFFAVMLLESPFSAGKAFVRVDTISPPINN